MRNLPSDYQSYIHTSRYARWREEDGRRETWPETVERYITFFINKFDDLEIKDALQECYTSILNLDVMPSMRALMTAGEALERDNIAGYNCSYVAVDNPRVFDEVMYVLMCGTGVGFSVEREDVAKLPIVAEEFHVSGTTIRVKDSRIGWASSYRELISLLYSGQIPQWDLSSLRPAGARLKTFGGRSSGPEPLNQLFHFTVDLFKKAAGRKLNSLEVHDLVCKIADIVVVGGVRRSALISLSNLTDDRLRNAKGAGWYYQDEKGVWKSDNPQRSLANNSVAYTEKPDLATFLKEWTSLYESRSGERGLFNRVAATKQAKSNGRRKVDGHNFGTNPCGEIILRSMGLCNLSEVVVRSSDTFETLKRKVKLATIIGTLQSTLTDFRYVRSTWKRNAEEERLLGVSLTGIMDHPILSGKDRPDGDTELPKILEVLRDEAIQTNKEWAERLGINASVAITTIKPSGTVSQLVDSSSGIHPRYSRYYVRTVRGDQKDPLCQFLKGQGVPCEPSADKPNDVYVFSFPRKSPDESVLREELTALQQLEHYLVYKKHWCEHNPSITVYVREDEWLEVGTWVYKHFNDLGGVSFLPYDDHVYQQAPYQPCNEVTYEKLLSEMPEIDWEKFNSYETEDNVMIQPELACSAGNCEI
jgi:ribonucleoside-diphosphate reductase alpha chain